MNKFIIATVSVFLAWSFLDFIVHGLLLAGSYADTASLWRPQPEMKLGLISLTTLASAAGFSAIYKFLVNSGSQRTGVIYGLLFAMATGVAAGPGVYAVMPVPMGLGLAWMAAVFVEGLLGGLIVAGITGIGEHDD